MISSTCSIRWRPSPRPDPTFSFAAERSDGQGWLKAIAKRLALDGREHSGRPVRSGEAACSRSASPPDSGPLTGRARIGSFVPLGELAAVDYWSLIVAARDK